MDVALQEYGHWAGCLWILEDNPDRIKSITQTIAGFEIKIRDAVISGLVKKELEYHSIATADKWQGEAIGRGRIGVDFKIVR